MTKKKLRAISGVMLAAAVIFILSALSNPALGTAIYIFGFRVGAAVWRKFYLLYTVVTLSLFAASLLIKE